MTLEPPHEIPATDAAPPERDDLRVRFIPTFAVAAGLISVFAAYPLRRQLDGVWRAIDASHPRSEEGAFAIDREVAGRALAQVQLLHLQRRKALVHVPLLHASLAGRRLPELAAVFQDVPAELRAGVSIGVTQMPPGASPLQLAPLVSQLRALCPRVWLHVPSMRTALDRYSHMGVQGVMVDAGELGANGAVAEATLRRYVQQGRVQSLRVGVENLASGDVAAATRRAGAVLLSGPAIAADVPHPVAAYPYGLPEAPVRAS